MAKYRILWQAATEVARFPDYVDAIKSHARRILSPDFTLDIRGVDFGTLDLQFSYFQFLNDAHVLRSILKASKEAYDGVAVGCICDSGVHSAREVMDIPVGGLAESGMLAACMYGRTFCIVTYMWEEAAKRIEDLIRLYGFKQRAERTEYFEMPLSVIANAFRNPGPVIDAFKEAAQRAVERGAEVILPGCGILNMLAVQDGLTRVGGSTVLDVSGALMKSVEAMVVLDRSLGIKVSRRGLYASPSPEQLEGAKRIYGAEW